MPSSSGLLPCPSGELYGTFTTNFVTIRPLQLVLFQGWDGVLLTSEYS